MASYQLTQALAKLAGYLEAELEVGLDEVREFTEGGDAKLVSQAVVRMFLVKNTLAELREIVEKSTDDAVAKEFDEIVERLDDGK